MEGQINDHLAKIQISEKFRDWALKYLRELHEMESQQVQETIQSRRKTYDDCLLRIGNLVKLKTSAANSDGSQLSDEEYSRQRLALMKEKASLEKSLQDVGLQIETCLQRSEQAFEFASTVREQFMKGNFETKKEIVSTLGSNLTLKDKTLIIEARKLLFLLETALNPSTGSNGTFEPKTIVLPRGQNQVSDPTCPILRGRRDDVRAYRHKAERAAALIYAHFRKEFGFSDKR